jgi:hypothetical protein
LKIYTGSAFVPPGANVPYQSDAPTALTQGDLWIDSDTAQMFFYNGSSSVLVGPPSASGTTNGFTYDAIMDSNDGTQNITKLYNDGNLIAIISEDTFTPKSSISGFATITKGITLSTAIANLRFAGTASDTDKLGGIVPANYLRSNENDTTSGTFGVVNDSGMTIGADSDLLLTVDTTGVNLTNATQDTDISIKVNDGGTTTTVLTVDGGTSRIGIGTTTPTTKLQVSGTITATEFAGPFTGNLTGNITSTGANSMTTLTMGDTLTTKTILPDTTVTYDVGSSTKKYNTVYAKATSAQYADLAEVYESDSEYEIGTVVVFGGDKEVTQSTVSNDTRVAGVISDNPAYIMNDESDGQAVALVGKVACKIHGMVSKGDLLTTCGTHPGCAQKALSPVLGSIVGKAMENKDTADESVILISVGRL